MPRVFEGCRNGRPCPWKEAGYADALPAVEIKNAKTRAARNHQRGGNHGVMASFHISRLPRQLAKPRTSPKTKIARIVQRSQRRRKASELCLSGPPVKGSPREVKWNQFQQPT